MAQRGAVPKFGNWNSNDVGYTMYFEKARESRGAPQKFTNPNDPEDNPDVNFPAKYMGSPALQKPNNNSTRTTADAKVDAKSSARPPTYYQKPNRGPGETSYGSAGSRSPLPNASPHHKVTAVPKFGVWNDGNAAPPEGFTVTFNKIKDERNNNIKGYNDMPSVPDKSATPQRVMKKKTSFMRKVFWFLYPSA